MAQGIFCTTFCHTMLHRKPAIWCVSSTRYSWTIFVNGPLSPIIFIDFISLNTLAVMDMHFWTASIQTFCLPPIFLEICDVPMLEKKTTMVGIMQIHPSWSARRDTPTPTSISRAYTSFKVTSERAMWSTSVLMSVTASASSYILDLIRNTATHARKSENSQCHGTW